MINFSKGGISRYGVLSETGTKLWGFPKGLRITGRTWPCLSSPQQRLPGGNYLQSWRTGFPEEEGGLGQGHRLNSIGCSEVQESGLTAPSQVRTVSKEFHRQWGTGEQREIKQKHCFKRNNNCHCNEFRMPGSWHQQSVGCKDPSHWGLRTYSKRQHWAGPGVNTYKSTTQKLRQDC